MNGKREATRFATFVTALVAVFVFVAAIGCGCGGDSGEKTTPSDYSKAGNWLALPARSVHSADVFYLYPTAYKAAEGGPVFASIDNAGMRAGAQNIFMQQATAFADAADLYAPFYRQADGMTVLAMSADAKDSLLATIPKADVFAALDWYFEHYNNGRPFILAGHSQGSNMLRFVLSEYMAKHPERYARMVAAYVIGYSIDKKFLAANPLLKFAESADDTGVVISWNTEAPVVTGNNPVWLPGSISINPLSWRRDGAETLSADNPGSLTRVLDGGELSLDVPGIANAYVDMERGTVKCSTVEQSKYETPAEMQPVFGTGIYHGSDYAFYYKSIGENAKKRIEAWLANSSSN